MRVTYTGPGDGVRLAPTLGDLWCAAGEPVDVPEDVGRSLCEQGTFTDPGAAPGNVRPAAGARKDVWVDYAVHLGLDREAVDALSKGDLVGLIEALEDGTHVIAEDGQVVEATSPPAAPE